MPERGRIDAVLILKRQQKRALYQKKVAYVFCGPTEGIWTNTKESAGMGNEEERTLPLADE